MEKDNLIINLKELIVEDEMNTRIAIRIMIEKRVEIVQVTKIGKGSKFIFTLK